MPTLPPGETTTSGSLHLAKFVDGFNNWGAAMNANLDVLDEAVSNIELTPGPAGPQGPQGSVGPEGPQGIQGPKGDTGAEGAKGDTGVTGATGAQGIPGVKGDTGPQGIPGTPGADGAKGDTGATGSQGIQGVKGDTGSQGTPGTAATVTIGTTTTGAAGSNAIVTNSGTSSAAILNFTIPKGADGTGGSGGGLADPGANGIIKRTALNTTAVAVAADFPTLNQDTTGTAAGLSANILESQVTNLVSDLAAKANVSSLSAVATSGSYNDLSSKPSIPAAQVQSDWNASAGMGVILNKPTLATVATSGSYTDLSSKPTIPTVPTVVSAFTNDAGYLTSASSVAAAKVTGLAASATTDTTNAANITSGVLLAARIPTLNQNTTGTAAGLSVNIAESQVTNLTTDLAAKANISSLAAVATSGSYTDLSNKPTIPAAQVQTDWNASTGMGVLLNKPTLATVATSGSYTDLSSKPTIPAASSTTPAMDGTAAIGSAATYAKADHVHPTDTSRAAATNPTLTQGSSLSAGSGSGSGIVGSGLTVGAAYYLASTGLALAKANASATTPAIGIAVSSTLCVFNGVFRFSSSQSWTVGDEIYLSDVTAGLVTNVEPSASGSFVQMLGIALAADTMLIMPSLDAGGIV